jgi:hypothetical protein
MPFGITEDILRHFQTNCENLQGSRKLEPLGPPVSDKPHAVGKNEIYMNN